MNSIIVSDLHVGSRYFLYERFERFLKNLPENDEFVLNGDIINNPYKKLKPRDQQIIDRIGQISFRQKVVWVRGNHDNGYCPSEFGQIHFRNHYSLTNQLLILHGYNFDEITPRNQGFIKAFRLLHNLRIKLGARPVHVAQYAKNWKHLYNVFRKNVMINAVKCALENGYLAVTCGHTHYPEEKVLNGIRYVNTGAWTESPSYYLHVTADNMDLRVFDE